MLSLSSLVILGLACKSWAFTLSDTYSGSSFLSSFTWETMTDPTNGTVNYVNQQYSVSNNLTFASGSKFVMRADYKQVPATTSRGRMSHRITSNKQYGDSIMVLDLTHMPEGQGTWPSWWTYSQGQKWPAGGEIDIIEGVNGATANIASLHASPNCSMGFKQTQLSTVRGTNCDATTNNNQGCGVTFSKANSYGHNFNSVGGGYYAMERSNATGIAIWFWPRNDTTVPTEVKNGANSISSTSTWGTPSVQFTFDSCNYASHFDNTHAIIFDLTFCGGMAGTPVAWAAAGMNGTCDSYVRNNPSQFQNAYWEINSLKVYQ